MRKKIGELLVETGAISSDVVKIALGNQRSWGSGLRLGQVLVSMGAVTQDQVAKALGTQFELPFVDLPQIASSVSSLVPLEFQTQHMLVPFQLESDGRSERLLVAVADPANLEVIEELRFQIGKPVKVFVASKTDIQEVLAALHGDAVDVFHPLDVDEVTPVTHGERGRARAAPAPEPPEPLQWELLPTAKPPPPPEVEVDVLLTPPPRPIPEFVRTQIAQVVKFEKALTPPQGAAADELAEGAARAPALEVAPTFGGAAAPDAPRFTRSTPVVAAAAPVDGGTRVAALPSHPPPMPTAQVPVTLQLVPPGAPAPVPAKRAAQKPPPAEPPRGAIDFSDEDLAILENLERLASGEDATVSSPKIQPTQMVAALIRLLMKKGVIGETEFLDELSRK